MFKIRGSGQIDDSGVVLSCHECDAYIDEWGGLAEPPTDLRQVNAAAIHHYATRHQGMPSDDWPSTVPGVSVVMVAASGTRDVIAAWHALQHPTLLNQAAVLNIRTMAPVLSAALDLLAGIKNGH